jgi:hypothetical protein
MHSRFALRACSGFYVNDYKARLNRGIQNNGEKVAKAHMVKRNLGACQGVCTRVGFCFPVSLPSSTMLVSPGCPACTRWLLCPDVHAQTACSLCRRRAGNRIDQLLFALVGDAQRDALYRFGIGVNEASSH